MKTLLIIMLFSMNSYAQDTTYYQRRGELYMNIRTQVKDVNTYKLQYSVKKRKANTRFIVIVGVFFAGLTTWYFQPYSH